MIGNEDCTRFAIVAVFGRHHTPISVSNCPRQEVRIAIDPCIDGAPAARRYPYDLQRSSATMIDTE